MIGDRIGIDIRGTADLVFQSILVLTRSGTLENLKGILENSGDNCTGFFKLL